MTYRGYMVNLTEKMTQEEFGRLVGISQSAISDLHKRGILTAGIAAGEWLLQYCAHLREVAAGRLASGDLDLAGERARLAREQADKLAMQNAITRAELAPAHLLEEVLGKAGARVAGILEAIPGQLRRRNAGLSADDLQHVAREIAKARNVAASVSLADLLDEPQPEAGTGDILDLDDLQTCASSDSEG